MSLTGFAMGADRQVPPTGADCCEVEGQPKRKMGVAFMIACPACAGGFVLAVGTAFGVGALALKAGLLVAGLGLVALLWARTAWRRRAEATS